MEIELFTLCDYAQDNNGKLTIVGTFDRLYARSFPVVHSHMSVVTRLRFPAEKEGHHQIKIRLTDNEGKEMLQPVEGSFTTSLTSGMLYAPVNLVFNFINIQFKSAGRYAFEMYVDGEWQSGLSLFIMQMP